MVGLVHVVTLDNQDSRELLVLLVKLVQLEIQVSRPCEVNKAYPVLRDSPERLDSSELPDLPVCREVLGKKVLQVVLGHPASQADRDRKVLRDLLETPEARDRKESLARLVNQVTLERQDDQDLVESLDGQVMCDGNYSNAE